MRATQPVAKPEAAHVLAKAVLRAASLLGMPQKNLAEVIGLSPASVSRLARSQQLDPERKEGELALLFLRMYRSLDTLAGGNEESARRWFRAPNAHLQGVPADLVKSVAGLAHVVDYLDALRGKL
jgi:uncharacterized protein (DUF2384 family)